METAEQSQATTLVQSEAGKTFDEQLMYGRQDLMDELQDLLSSDAVHHTLGVTSVLQRLMSNGVGIGWQRKNNRNAASVLQFYNMESL